MGQILPNLEFLLVVDPKTIFFWFYKKACPEGYPLITIRTAVNEKIMLP